LRGVAIPLFGSDPETLPTMMLIENRRAGNHLPGFLRRWMRVNRGVMLANERAWKAPGNSTHLRISANIGFHGRIDVASEKIAKLVAVLWVEAEDIVEGC
jgi:hypothetical protein